MPPPETGNVGREQAEGRKRCAIGWGEGKGAFDCVDRAGGGGHPGEGGGWVVPGVAWRRASPLEGRKGHSLLRRFFPFDGGSEGARSIAPST